MLKPQEIIRKKRNGEALTVEDMKEFFSGFLDGNVSDYQVSAMLMAIYFKGMNRDETIALTKINLESGKKFEWNLNTPIVADKHSTGGVGDKTSLVLLPLAVLEGLKVPMMSGRGLGHTGGTLDKLESIPGMNVFPDENFIQKQIKEMGGVFLGQTPEIAALDKRLYALRDVTSTVESVPLITASILSKKLAEGLDHLVLDIKYGSGAFMQDENDARTLAESLVSVGTECGMGVRALLSSMNSVLGGAAGHTLEVMECIEIMKGRGSLDTTELTVELTLEMVKQAYPERSEEDIRKSLNDHLSSGRAFELFCKIISTQGGDSKFLEDLSKFEKAPFIKPIIASETGNITSIDVRSLGIAILGLGGGRAKVTDKIDPRVGLSGMKRVGTAVEKGEDLLFIHARSEEDWKGVEKSVEAAISIGSEKVNDALILDRFGSQ